MAALMFKQLFYVGTASKCTSDAGRSGTPTRSHHFYKVPLLCEKIEVLDLTRKERRLLAKGAKIYSKNKSFMKLGRKKKFLPDVLLHLKLAKVIATVHDLCLGGCKRHFDLWVQDRNRKYVLIDGKVLIQKALSLYQDFSKGSPGETLIHFLQVKDDHNKML